MRPTKKQLGAIGALLDEWARSHPLDPNLRQMAGMFNVSTSLLSQWRYCESMMQPDDMDTVSTTTGISYSDLSAALRKDTPRIIEHNAARRSTRNPPSKQG